MNPLKKAPVRAFILLLAGVLAAVCAYIFISAVVKYDYGGAYSEDTYIHSAEYREDINELYSKLWAVGNMYLANRSERVGFTVNSIMQSDIMNYLRWKDLVDYAGNIAVGEYDDLDYIVSCNGITLTNTDKSLDELSDCEYGIWQHGDDFRHDLSFSSSPDNWVYTTTYGKTVYIINGTCYTMYDFDTAGLSYYYYYSDGVYDEEGYIDGTVNSRNYYKLDGTTPLPPRDAAISAGHNIYFLDDRNDLKQVLEDDANSGEDQPQIFFIDQHDDTTAVYDIDNEKWISAPREEIFPVENDVYICIAPKEELVREYNDIIAMHTMTDDDEIRLIITIGSLAFAVMILAFMYFLYCGYDAKINGFKLLMIDKVYTEITLAAIAVIGLGTAAYIFQTLDLFLDELGDIRLRIAFSASLGFIGIIMLIMAGSLINKLKCRRFIKTTLIYMLITYCSKRMKENSRKFREYYQKTVLMSNTAYYRQHFLRHIIGGILLILILIGLGTYTIDGEVFALSAIALVLLYGLLIVFDMRDAWAFSRLSERIEKIKEGDYSSEEPKLGEVTYKMQEDLNSVSSGVNKAVDERIRSERMKIDLVTNVSHDLKTPLTSVISYVDLLSKEELTDEAKDYVDILVDKTQRLKDIISDLFDLAKATSETDMELEELDAVILVRQVLGDMEDKIDRYGRDIRTDIKAESVKVVGEGKKLYRVVQNVIDNALKYSLENTRIYLTLSQTETHAVITVKNIASYEMNFTGDEIVERFARADKSRTSEGNGLGLSIAKSFAQACGGSFEVIPEGDVFTAELRLKKTQTEQ